MCVSVCVFMCVGVSVTVNTSKSSWSLSLILLFSSFLIVSVILFSLYVLHYVFTPLHCEVPEGLVSRRGSGGFSPSLSLEDASTSC